VTECLAMIPFNKDGAARATAASSVRACSGCAGLTYRRLVLAVAAVALAGCGSGPGTFLVDPGHYSVMHCKDLIDARNALIKRQQELQKLQNMASQSAGGAIIGKMAYGTDYDTAVTDQKIVEREAREKNCETVHTYQSDQTIR
jgi:hypothetical protein